MFKRFFFWRHRGKEARALALRSEILATELNALQLNEDKPERDIVTILHSTCALLARLQERQALEEPAPLQADQPPPEEFPSLKIASPLSNPPVPLEPSNLPDPPAKDDLAVLGPSAQDLMKLSDWVLLARAANVPVQPAVLNEIHRQIVKVLGKEGVTLLNETGHCDYARQAIVRTESTDDPAQHECIASTVRPGYLFGEQVLRPQEVIVYTYP